MDPLNCLSNEMSEFSMLIEGLLLIGIDFAGNRHSLRLFEHDTGFAARRGICGFFMHYLT